ncbi:MAG: hypothetical protein JWO56_35 [Acidobacteria bacterium]|nr:hypothetical protein [Acidobacteriota bacterium]
MTRARGFTALPYPFPENPGKGDERALRGSEAYFPN